MTNATVTVPTEAAQQFVALASQHGWRLIWMRDVDGIAQMVVARDDVSVLAAFGGRAQPGGTCRIQRGNVSRKVTRSIAERELATPTPPHSS